jgi:hypothetical protein
MTKFTDGKQIATIEMIDNSTGCAWEHDFFEVGGLKLNEELNAYEVEDVNYLIDYAQSYVDGTNPDVEYTTDGEGNIINPNTTLDYLVEVL